MNESNCSMDWPVPEGSGLARSAIAVVSLLSRLRAMRVGSPSPTTSAIRFAIRMLAVSETGASLCHSSIPPSVAVGGALSNRTALL
jgi:hypothetical protein